MDIQPKPNAAGWYNSDITITLIAQASQASQGIQYIDYEFPNISGESTLVKDSQAIIPFSAEGINLFRYGAEDKEGNDTGQKSTSIQLDKTPPAIAITFPQAGKDYPASQDIALTWTATDSLAGIDTKTVTLDGVDVTAQTTVKPTAGSHTLIVTAKDKAGNTATKQITFNVVDNNKIKANVEIKPEVFLRNSGVFIAIVKLPAPYQKEKILSASCNGAPAKKIISLKDASLLIFKRQDITQWPQTTHLRLPAN